MKRSIGAFALFTLVIGLTLLGACSSEEAAEKIEEAKEAVAEKAGDAHETVAEKAADAHEAVAEKVEGAVETVKSKIADLPDGFPSDIPVYPNAKYVKTVVSENGITMVKLTSTDKVDAIADYYDAALKKAGWHAKPSMDNPSGGKILPFDKDDTGLSVQLTEQPEETKISLNVMGIK